MNDQELKIEGLDEVYRKSCALADEIGDNNESKKDADVRLAMMFINYAKTHNLSGKFELVYDEDFLVAECERFLMYTGNTAYFDYRLTAYRNNTELLNMLRDALKLLNNHESEIVFRKKDATFLDKIHDGHIAEVERLDNEVETLIAELDTKQDELSKFGFFSKRTIRKNDYTGLEKEVKDLQERKEQLEAEASALESAYAQCHDNYHRYMQNLSFENADKISRYFFSEYDDDFEQIHGMSNQFEADRGWLKEKIDAAIDIVGSDQDTYQQLQDMLAEATANNEI